MIAGCAAKRAPESAPASGSADLHAQIDALDRQITDELSRAHITPPPAESCTGAACSAAMSQPFATPAPVSPNAPDATCHPAVSDHCQQTCTLSTSICANQDKICDLARQLAGDDWAANKCASARSSCQAAHETCCTCVL
jgi:hypothetical protein